MDQAEYTSNLESECGEIRKEEVLTKRRKKPKTNILPGEEQYYNMERDESSDYCDEERPNRKGKNGSFLPFPTSPKPIPRQTGMQSPSSSSCYSNIGTPPNSLGTYRAILLYLNTFITKILF